MLTLSPRHSSLEKNDAPMSAIACHGEGAQRGLVTPSSTESIAGSNPPTQSAHKTSSSYILWDTKSSKRTRVRKTRASRNRSTPHLSELSSVDPRSIKMHPRSHENSWKPYLEQAVVMKRHTLAFHVPSPSTSTLDQHYMP